MWQVNRNAIIKHQHPYRYAMDLQTSYYDPKYLAKDKVRPEILSSRLGILT